MTERERLIQDVIAQCVRMIEFNSTLPAVNHRLWDTIGTVESNFGIRLTTSEQTQVYRQVEEAFISGIDNGYGCEVEFR